MSHKTYPYAYKMTPTHDDYPEVAVGHDLPEAYVQPHPEPVWSPQPSIAPTYVSQPHSAYPPSAYGQNGQYTDAVKPGSSAGAGAAVGGVMSHDASYQAPGSADPEKTTPPAAATVCGISLVLLLSIIIAILSAAVIGLAAGTGVAASNYNDAKARVRELDSALAQAQARGTPTSSGGGSSKTSAPTDWNSITNGCSDNPGDVNGTRYTSQSFDNTNFTMYCNKDTHSLSPVYSLFANNFNGCMDACAGWNHYNTTKGKCVGISFIPSWSVLATALQGGAPGDCYLKPAPLTTANLTDPNIGGGEVHTALLVSKSK
ncbi:hypothetical protein MKX08_002486 [Trichoderma sp. CBMAI-0020]|nr:hypothetical protein MKX08_002486 [Trichoderma sp. CBMAI-0020]